MYRGTFVSWYSTYSWKLTIKGTRYCSHSYEFIVYYLVFYFILILSRPTFVFKIFFRKLFAHILIRRTVEKKLYYYYHLVYVITTEYNVCIQTYSQNNLRHEFRSY
uniref:Uncharacterized protein n=1 Tax=Cacopsylla melanoneura TaxID=428564 RepID=A0A8D9B2X2_9HEMI